MKKRFLFLFILPILLLASACSEENASKDVVGAWKAVDAKNLAGKPLTLLIDEKRVTIGSDSVDVAFGKKDGKILIRRAGEEQPILVATVLSKDSVTFTSHIFGERVFTRSTPAELKAIEAAPSKLQSKEDPF